MIKYLFFVFLVFSVSAKASPIYLACTPDDDSDGFELYINEQSQKVTMHYLTASGDEKSKSTTAYFKSDLVEFTFVTNLLDIKIESEYGINRKNLEYFQKTSGSGGSSEESSSKDYGSCEIVTPSDRAF